MVKTLQVGIICASAERGWAKISHVPAVQGVEGLALGAVVTRDQPPADKAAAAFGARWATPTPPPCLPTRPSTS